MRRVLSILLALAFGLGPMAFAMGYDESASLPACCRRHGAHHCGMSSQADPPGEQMPGLTTAHCPLFPTHQSASPSPISAIVHWPLAASLSVLVMPIGTATTFANSAANRSTLTLRGPPAFPSA